MSNRNKADTYYLMIKIAKEAPQSTFYFFIYVLIKYIPYFLITHDFNINLEMGISYYVRIISFGEVFKLVSKRELLFFVELVCLILGVISFILWVYLAFQHKKYSRLSSFQKKLLSKIASFIFVLNFIDQYIYALIIESIFCQNGNNKPSNYNDNSCHDVLYYIGIIVGIVLMIYCLIISLMANLLFSIPYFNSKGLFTSSLKIIETTLIMCSLFQIIIQLEFHLPLDTILLIKHVARAIIFIDYCVLFYSHRWFYISYTYEYGVLWFKTACSVSIIIEWIFYYDIKNNLKILVSSSCLLAMKLLIEILLSWLIVYLYIRQDNKKIVNFILNISSKPVSFEIETANKVFYSIYYGKNENLFMKIIEAIQDNYKNNLHSPKCIKNCLFCNEYSDYSIELFQAQYLGLKDKFNKNKKDKTKLLLIKSSFPFVYNMLEYIVIQNYERQQNQKKSEYVNSLFLLVVFYFAFEENYYKSLFYIEQISKTSLYNQNWLFKIRINQFQHHICSEYKSQISQPENMHYKRTSNINDLKIQHIIEMQHKYKSIEKIIKTENYLKQTIEAYSALLTNFAAEDIPYNTFLKSVKAFKHCYDVTEASLPILMKGKECSVPYYSTKIDLFYSFFNTNHASSLQNYDNFFNKNHISPNFNLFYYVIVISAHYSNNKMIFQLDYVSDELITILKYTPEEFKNTKFEDLLSKTFIRPYCYLIEQSIREGDDIIDIPNFCLVDKDHYSMMFNFRGVTIFSQNTLKIFAKVDESKEQVTINMNEKENKKGKKDKSKKKIDNLCNYCFLFTNKRGKIISICRDFESIFFLSSKTVKKYSINIKEILKLEQLNKEGTITKHLSVIYDNIIDNNLSKVGTIGEDEYSKQIEGIKEIHQMLQMQQTPVKVVINYQEKRIIKGKGVFKKYYLFVISLENNEINEFLMQPTIREGSINLYIRNSLSKPITSFQYTNNALPKNNSIKELLFLIRCFSYKYLYLRYGIKKSIDKNELYKKKQDYIETMINEKAFPNNEPISLTNNDEKGFNNPSSKNKLQKDQNSIRNMPIGIHIPDVKIKFLPKFPKYKTWHKVISFILPMVFIITLIALFIWKMFTISLLREVFVINGKFLLIRNTFNEIVALTLYMLFQSNSLQNDKIDDNKYDNSYDFHKEKIYGVLSNFVIDYQFFLDFFTTNLNKLNTFFFEIIFTPFNITIMKMNRKKKKGISQFMNEHYMTLQFWQIQESVPLNIFFNRTDGVYVDKSVNYYAEAAYVKIIENQLTIMKAIYSELLNAFPENLVDTWIQQNIHLSEAITILSGILLLYGIFNFIYNLKQMSYLYAKYFISFVELRYFHLYLSSKTNHVSEFIINNGDNRNVKTICQDITIASHQHETMQLKKTLTEIADNLHLIRIKAFYPKTIETKSNSTSRKEGSSFVQTNSIVHTPSHRSYNSGTINSLMSHKKKTNKSSNFYNNQHIKHKNSIQQTNTSTATYKGGNSTASSNVQMISMMATNTPHVLLTKQSSDQNGKRLLNKPKDYIINFFISLTLLIIFFIIGVVNITLTYSNLSFIKMFIEVEAIVFNNINFCNELLLSYQISVLKNEELSYYYKPKGYLNNCIEAKEVNNLTEHIAFEELSSCYQSYSSRIETIIAGGFSSSNDLKTVRKYMRLTNSEAFCEIYAKEYDKNRKDYDSEANTADYEQLLKQCQNIGNKLNSKGLLTALDTMYVTLVNSYKDFKSDEARTAKSNYDRLNNKEIQTFQAEMVYLLFNLPVNYMKSFKIDFDAFELKIKQTEILIIVSQCTIFTFIFIFLVHSLIKMSIDEENIEFLEKCIINTILF